MPGVDAVFVGPNDLAYSMRSADGTPPGKELFEATLTRIREAAQRNRLPCGLHVFTAADALKRAREGWQFIAVGSELKMMLDGAADVTRQINGDAASRASWPSIELGSSWPGPIVRSLSVAVLIGSSSRILAARVTTSTGSCSQSSRLNSSSESGPR